MIVNNLKKTDFQNILVNFVITVLQKIQTLHGVVMACYITRDYTGHSASGLWVKQI
jgi:hypothetical protein